MCGDEGFIDAVAGREANLEFPSGASDSPGSRILRVRRALGLTQRELADLVGVRLWQIDQWERDERDAPPEQLDGLARALGCSATWLLTGSGTPDTAGGISPSVIKTPSTRTEDGEYRAALETPAKLEAALLDEDEGREARDRRMSAASLRAANQAADALLAQATRQARAILEDALREREQAAAEHARAKELREAIEQAP